MPYQNINFLTKHTILDLFRYDTSWQMESYGGMGA